MQLFALQRHVNEKKDRKKEKKNVLFSVVISRKDTHSYHSSLFNLSNCVIPLSDGQEETNVMSILSSTASRVPASKLKTFLYL